MVDYNNKMLGKEDFEPQSQSEMTKAELRKVIQVLQSDNIFFVGQRKIPPYLSEREEF